MRAENEIVQFEYQNPQAENALLVPILLMANTERKVIETHIRLNSRKYHEWLKYTEPHDGTAVIVGGGPSVADFIDDIRSSDGTIFALNAASHWLNRHGIKPDYQCMVDAKEESASLADPGAACNLFASQVHPKTLAAVKNPLIWHLAIQGIEELLPEDRVKAGGYVLVGGGVCVGISALCAAYCLGFRKFELYGYDSSHDGADSHAYFQQQNVFMPTVHVTWAGREFLSSVAMKAQAEKFMETSAELEKLGCDISVHGDGLLPHMYRTDYSDLSEKEKYTLLWQSESYRNFSPGEQIVDQFLDLVEPKGTIVDFGCGTGRAALRLADAGHDVLLVDFAENCRDEEAMHLPFAVYDLTKPINVSADYGLCTDVMEHIEPENIDAVIRNIMDSANTVFFQISTIQDSMGALIGHKLHLTVRPLDWWRERFEGYEVSWSDHNAIACKLVVKRREQ